MIPVKGFRRFALVRVPSDSSGRNFRRRCGLWHSPSFDRKSDLLVLDFFGVSQRQAWTSASILDSLHSTLETSSTPVRPPWKASSRYRHLWGTPALPLCCCSLYVQTVVLQSRNPWAWRSRQTLLVGCSGRNVAVSSWGWGTYWLPPE